MKRAISLLAACLAVFAPVAEMARAQTTVAIELVLAVDASSSVSQDEFNLQMSGIAEAFRSPEVTQIIAQGSGVAVTLFQWSSWANLEHALPWRLLDTEAAILSFAEEIEAAPRAPAGNLTGLGNAIAAALRTLDDNQFAGRRQKIDISGDGQSNSGLPLEEARGLARAMGVTVNGLAILTDFPRLETYYREQIISGPDAFVIAAADYADFARAMKIKLLRELTATVSRRDAPSKNRFDSRIAGGQ